MLVQTLHKIMRRQEAGLSPFWCHNSTKMFITFTSYHATDQVCMKFYRKTAPLPGFRAKTDPPARFSCRSRPSPAVALRRNPAPKTRARAKQACLDCSGEKKEERPLFMQKSSLCKSRAFRARPFPVPAEELSGKRKAGRSRAGRPAPCPSRRISG